MFLDESHELIGQLGGMYNGDRARKTTLVEYGFRLPSRAGQPAAEVRGIRERDAPGDLRLGHAGGLRADSMPAQVVEQLVRPTGLVDPEVEVRPGHAPGGRRAAGDPHPRGEERAGADHDADQAHGRAADGLPDRQRRQGALPAQRHRHGGAGGDPARPAAGRSSTCWWASTCCARAWTFPRCRWWRSWTPTRRASCAPSAR